MDPIMRDAIERLLALWVIEIVKESRCREDDNHDCEITNGRAAQLVQEYAGRIASEIAKK